MLGVLDLGIDLQVWPWIWLITAVVFTLLELTVVGGMFIILPWAVSAFIAAILAFYDVPIEIQWGVFVFGGAALFAFMYQWAQGFMRKNTVSPGVGADRLVGLVGTVTTPINPADTDRRGRIMLEGEIWGVVDPPRAFDEGEQVRVTAMKGTRVVVVPVTDPSDPTDHLDHTDQPDDTDVSDHTDPKSDPPPTTDSESKE